MFVHSLKIYGDVTYGSGTKEVTEEMIIGFDFHTFLAICWQSSDTHNIMVITFVVMLATPEQYFN